MMFAARAPSRRRAPMMVRDFWDTGARPSRVVCISMSSEKANGLRPWRTMKSWLVITPQSEPSRVTAT